MLAELRAALPALLASSRWWCGIAYAAGKKKLERIAKAHGPGPLAPMLGELASAAWGLFGELGAEAAELQRRWDVLLNEGGMPRSPPGPPRCSPTTIPPGRSRRYHSADLQIAAPSTDAIERGDFLVVLGDFHGGAIRSSKGSSLAGTPSRTTSLRASTPTSTVQVVILPRAARSRMTAAAEPLAGKRPHVQVVSGSLDAAPAGIRAVSVADLSVADGQVTDRAGSFRAALADFLWGPDLHLRDAKLRPVRRTGRARDCGAHGAQPSAVARAPVELPRSRRRSQPGRATEVSRAACSCARRSSASPSTWTSRARCSLRVLARFLKPVAERAPEAPILFTEMLPGPDECWLQRCQRPLHE